MRYQDLKRKPVTKAQARKNMMVYLNNMVGFKMDFFKGMTYTEKRQIFENHFNSIWAFLEKGEKEIEEEDSKRKSENLEQKAAKKQKIDKEETDEVEPAEVEEVLEVVTATKLMTKVVTTATTPIVAAPVPKASAPRRRRGVIIQDPKEVATASLSV
nr:hypothetical protein [Tanacetum cinerariifolium]